MHAYLWMHTGIQALQCTHAADTCVTAVQWFDAVCVHRQVHNIASTVHSSSLLLFIGATVSIAALYADVSPALLIDAFLLSLFRSSETCVSAATPNRFHCACLVHMLLPGF